MAVLTTSPTTTTPLTPTDSRTSAPRAGLHTAAQVRRYKRHTRYLEIAIVVVTAGFALTELLLAG